MSKVVVRAPTRLDFGGGWTDVPPYCEREGGFVCNVAITRYATATLTSGDAAEERHVGNGHEVADAPLLRAVLKRGADVPNLRLSLASDFPVGAGLGGSSAASAALLGALAVALDRPWNLAGIAEEGRSIEVEDLGVAGGRQDHYAATHGGALALTFTHDVKVKRLPITGATIAALERRCTLVYTGESRISGDTITAVLDAYETRERRVLQSLSSMKRLAKEMAGVLGRGDVDSLGALMGEHWTHQRVLHPAIPTPKIDEIVDRANNAGALGAKAMGASGGGCVLVLAPDSAVERVRDAVTPLGTVLPFRIDSEGLSRSA